MDEEVFLVFVPFAVAVVGVALFVVRRWEAGFRWERFRLSSLLWTTMISLVVAGFVNLSDWWPLLGAWLLLSALILRRIRHTGSLGAGDRLLWSLLSFTPGGWVLFLRRFPHLHSVDAEASHLLSEPVGARPDFAALCSDRSERG